MKDLVKIDGSKGEGGGQVLRTSLSLSAITGHELSIANIRARRTSPGLKRQHLTCVNAVAEICNAKVSDVGVGSRELEFSPGKIKSGNYRFDIGTAGSVTLVAQTVIPVLLNAEGESTVTITGGTHVPFSPTWEFFELCYLPELRRMGADVEAEIEQPGFYPAAGGVIKLKIKPFDLARRPERFELAELGAYKGGKVVGGHFEWETDGRWEDFVWHANWKLSSQKETLHYRTNADVISHFSKTLRDMCRL